MLGSLVLPLLGPLLLVGLFQIVQNLEKERPLELPVVGAEHANRTPPLTGPYTEEHPFHEPFVLLAWMAAHTRTFWPSTFMLYTPRVEKPTITLSTRRRTMKAPCSVARAISS